MEQHGEFDKQLLKLVEFINNKARKYNIHEQALYQMYVDKNKQKEFKTKFVGLLTMR